MILNLEHLITKKEAIMNETMQEVRAMAEIIKENTGIELRWYEIAKLKHYYLCYNRNTFQTLWLFFLDVFGLDILAFSRTYILRKNILGRWEAIPYGSNWFRDERFKQYCQEHLREWRDDRCCF